jgi:hypothetical protein
MDILSAHWDVIMFWKLSSRTALLYAVFFLILGGYASYSLVRVFTGLGGSGEKAFVTRLERRITNVRQIILLLLLLFGMTVANEAFVWLRALRTAPAECDCVWPFGAWTVFAFLVLAALLSLHAFQWLATGLLQTDGVRRNRHGW